MTKRSMTILEENPTLSSLAQFALLVCQPRRPDQTLAARLADFLALRFGEAQAAAYLAAPEFRRILKARKPSVRR